MLCIPLFSTFCSHSLWSKVSNGTIAFLPPCSGLAPDKLGKVLLFNTTGGRKCDRFAVTATLNLPGGSGILMLHTCGCISVNTITLESSILRMYGCYTPLTVRSRSLCVVNMVVNVSITHLD